ncbi:hypothetical protein M3Y97_00495300 [Aphelenchoides bicaudatus]|nr:hypothetical protein M3Y97_00495300 [Aphelenchoides bicaudatus]
MTSLNKSNQTADCQPATSSEAPDTEVRYELRLNESATTATVPSVSPSPTEQSSRLSSNQSNGSMESIADSSRTPSSAYSNGSAYSDSSWPPQKGSIVSTEGGTSKTTMTSLSIDRKPEGRLKIRTLCLVGALLPGIGCYICVIYTYLFQFDRVMNFTSTNCDEVKSPFPPISYSIGVWKPQKYIWLIVLALHMPARSLYGFAYKSQYIFGQSPHKNAEWFPAILKLHMRLINIEAIGLILVSVIDIESSFEIHALCYAIWIIALNFNMLFNVILQHYSGCRELTDNHEKTFYVKCALFAVVYPLSVSTGISYGLYVLHCNAAAYAAFSIAEYMIVGINSSFYFTLIYELSGSSMEFHFRHDSRIIREEIAV